MRTPLLPFGIFLFICNGAFANAALPVVDVSAGGVSARAAFGDVLPTQPKVVARTATKQVETSSFAVNTHVTSGADILIPQRPTDNIWAKGENRTQESEPALRMPTSSEFVVQNDNYKLPEEELPDTESANISIASKKSAAIDAEMARLADMQRRADSSVHIRNIAAENRTASISAQNSDTTADTSVRRKIIPIDDSSNYEPDTARVASKKSTAEDFAELSPMQLKKAFKKTYVSDNKHLSTYQVDDRFDVASDVNSTDDTDGMDSTDNISATASGVLPLEIKISFRDGDSALSKDNYNLLSEYASIVVAKPGNAIQVSIPERATRSLESRKLAARRLAIVEQVLEDTGVAESRVMPVLSQRSDESFVLRIISNDQYDTMVEQKRDMFGDTFETKQYKSMRW